MKKSLQLMLTLFLCLLFASTYGQPFYNIGTSVTGGTATVTTSPDTQAEEAAVVTVTIADIEAGKQFLSIEVIAADLSVISTTLVSEGAEYTFEMPAQDVGVNVALEDIPAATYAIATSVTGGTATVTTNPATEAEEAAVVTVTIADIEAGKQFLSIGVIAADLSVISTTLVSEGAEYTFEMPAQAVGVNVTLEDIPAATYAIATSVTGGTATVTTNPATEAEEAAVVTVTIADIEAGKEFLSIEVIAADLSVISTTLVSEGAEYTFEMPAQAVSVNINLQDVVTDPIIINTQPQSATICSYDYATISIDAEATTAETLTYQWYYNNEIMTDSVNSSIIVNLAGEYKCLLTAGLDELYSEVAVLTVAEVNPELPAEIGACTGTTVVLNPGTFSSYEWNDLTTESTLSVTINGTYSVVVEDENGCTASAESIVSFSDEISIDLGEEVNVCSGSSANISAPASDSYVWGGGEDTQEILVSEGGWYYVTVTQGTCEANDSVLVNIVDLPEVFDLGETIYACEGTTVTIEGPEVTGANYLWSNAETTQNTDVTLTGTYSLTVSNEFGCEMSDDILVQFNNYAVINLHTGDTIYSCIGNTVTLDPQQGIEWLWSDSSTESTLDVETSDWYYVTVTVDGGCEGNDSVYVLFNTLPAIDLGENQAFCDGLSAVLTAPDAVEYLWNTGEITQSITIDTASVYSCTITDINGCMNSDEMTLAIYPLPVVDLGEDIIVDEDQILVFGAQQGHPEYLWSTEATTEFIIVNASDLELGENTISVTVTSSNGCSVTDEITITVIPGAGIDTDIANKFSVYPNPSNGIIEIKGNEIISVNVLNYTGKTMLTTNQNRIDLSDFAKGIYIVQINAKSGIFTSKVVLQ